MKRIRTGALAALAALAVVTAAACSDVLEVENPEVIESSTVDPEEDAATFALSAQNALFTAFDNLVVYGGWFSGGAWVDDTFDTRNEVALRVVTDRNGTVTDDVYTPLAQAVAQNDEVIRLLAGTAQEQSIHTARANLSGGYALVLMADHFCEGVIRGLAPLTPAETYGQAVQRFSRAVEIGTAAGSAGSSIVNAARVGLARAHLNRGEYQQAIAAAQQVPAAFVFNANRVDDPSNRARLGNTIYQFTADRTSLVVPAYFRALNDTRVGSQLQLNSRGQPLMGQGSNLEFYRQTKYSGHGSAVRLASGLEARYLAAEAQLKAGNPAPAQALVTERRAAGGTASVFDATAPLLTQLLDQKARDFFLEGQHTGDWRRNPAAMPYVPAAGTRYYVQAIDQRFGTQTCIPIPAAEKDFNPFYPKP